MRFLSVFTGFITLFCFSAFSQQLIINEVSQGTGAKEYVEFIVVGNPTCVTPVPCMDLRGIIIDDNNGEFGTGTGTGIATGAVRFANIPFWSCIPQGTLILIYNNVDVNPAIPSDDSSITDGNCTLVLPINSNLLEGQGISPTSTVSGYPSSTSSWLTAGGDWNQVAMSNTNDSFQIRMNLSSASATHAVSWGNNSLNNHIYFSGSATNKVFYFANSTNNNPSLQSNWISGDVGVNETPGLANNAANDAWIGGMNPQCGIPNNIQLTLTSTPTGCGSNCTGSANVVISGGTPPYQIAWSNSATSATISNLCAATYTVSVTDDAGCTLSDQVTVNPGTNNLIIQLNPTNETCLGLCDGEISSTVTGGGQPYSYVWSNGQTSPGIVTLCSGDYSLTVTDNFGCTAVSNSTINPGSTAPDATITTSGPFGTNDAPVQMLANSTGGTWTADCGTCITTAGVFDPQSVLAGSYEICYANGNGTCTDTDCQTIIVTDGCTPQATSSNLVGCPGVSVQINGSTVTNPGEYPTSYIGQNGCDSTHTVVFSWFSTSPINMNINKCEGDFVEVNGVVYTESILLTNNVVDLNGCNVTNTYSINFEDCTVPEYIVFIPNTFTPNNDNVNEIFEITLSGSTLESGYILNRWGHLIHEFTPADLKWNGETKQGDQVVDGVYTYVVMIRKLDGAIDQYQGFVTVVR